MCSTLPWLGRTTLALLLVVALPRSARANFIDLVSQSYLIHGYGFLYASTPGGIVMTSVVDYVETSDTPISRHDVVTGGGGGIILDTSADGGMTPASAFVQAESSQLEAGNAITQFAEATAAITFRPVVTNLVVQTPGGFGFPLSRGISGLYDLTAGATVLAFEGFITPAGTLSRSIWGTCIRSTRRRLMRPVPLGSCSALG